MKMIHLLMIACVGVGLMTALVFGADEIPKNRAKQILDAAPAKARVQPKKARRVLIWITPPHLMPKDPHKGYCIPYGTHAMKTLGEKTGAFEPVVSDDVSVFLPDSIRRFDAIVLNNASQKWITPSDEAMTKLKDHGDKEVVEKLLRRSFTEWVKSGGGIVALHYAIGANGHWPEFKEMLGAGYWGHPWNEEVAVKVEEPDHPLVAAFDGKDFRVAEEIFQFREPYSRSKLRVLLSLDTKNTNMTVKWIHRKDGDFALAWVRPYGKGRVFYTAFGHRAEIYSNPKLLQFYLDGIQFATGDLEAPMTPRAKTEQNPATFPRPSAAGPKRKAQMPTEQEIEKIRNLQLFRACISRAEARRGELRKMLDRAFGGALTPMLKFLIEHEGLSAEETAELRELVEQSRKRQKSAKVSR